MLQYDSVYDNFSIPRVQHSENHLVSCLMPTTSGSYLSRTSEIIECVFIAESPTNLVQVTA